MKKRTLVDIVSLFLVLLFVYTGTMKIFDHAGFVSTLRKSPLVGHFAPYVSIAIPAIEFTIAFFLLLPRLQRWGLRASFYLMAFFTLYIGYMLIYTPHLPCSCGGVIKLMSWKQHLFFNSAVTLMAGTAAWWYKKTLPRQAYS
jgi:putative oxidoreductase